MGIRLAESATRLIDGRNYAVLATVNADGSPQTSVMWIGRDGDDVLFSTVEGRRVDEPRRRPPFRHRAVLEVRRPRPGRGPARRGPGHRPGRGTAQHRSGRLTPVT